MNDRQAKNGPADVPERTGGSIVYVVTPDSLDLDMERGGDLLSLFQTLWKAKWTIIVAAGVGMVASVVYSLLADEWYRAEVVMVAAERSDRGLADQLGGLGGLAGLAGLSLGAKTNAEPLAVLRSKQFIGSFIDDYKLIPVLFARDWDASAGRCRHTDPSDCPDKHDAFKMFSEKVFEAEEDKKAGLIMVTVEWKDPQLAASWANALIERLNERMRQRALEETAANVEYLKQELTGASVIPLQQSIGRVLQSELQKAMLARVTKEYAFRIVDPAQAPKWRIWPKRVQLVAFATIVAGLLSSLFVLGMNNVRDKRARSR